MLLTDGYQRTYLNPKSGSLSAKTDRNDKQTNNSLKDKTV